MEKQPDSKLTLVLMAGLSGSGKTTLATALGQKLDWPVLSKDDFMMWLLEMHADISNEKAGRDAYDLVLKQARKFLVRHRLSLILDTAANLPFILEQATNIVISAEGLLRVIHCTVIHQLREERLFKRTATREYPEFMGNPESLKSVDEDEYFKHLPPDRKIIDTRLSPEECLASALKYLGYPG